MLEVEHVVTNAFAKFHINKRPANFHNRSDNSVEGLVPCTVKLCANFQVLSKCRRPKLGRRSKSRSGAALTTERQEQSARDMSIPTFLIEDQESMKAENKFLSSHSPIT